MFRLDLAAEIFVALLESPWLEKVARPRIKLQSVTSQLDAQTTRQKLVAESSCKMAFTNTSLQF